MNNLRKKSVFQQKLNKMTVIANGIFSKKLISNPKLYEKLIYFFVYGDI
jgi:hypothetical protein